MPLIETISSSDVKSRALQAQGPVVLDFYQASCPPCRTLEPRLARVAQQFTGSLQVFRVDIDRDLPLIKRFDVMSLPTILIIKGGKEIARLDGLITEGQLQAAFRSAIVT